MKPLALSNLERAFDLELTYSSNAFEGNTLTQLETNLVIEHGVTVGGKSLKDHLEAIDHHETLGFVPDIAVRDDAVTEHDVRSLHIQIMRRSAPDLAGSYAKPGRHVNADPGRFAFPSPAEIPALMGDFGLWLQRALQTPDESFRRLLYARLADSLTAYLPALAEAEPSAK